MFRYRDKKTATQIAEQLKRLNLKIRGMHVCGTHQDTIVRYGLDSIFKQCGVEMRQGPGCPVCVTTIREYEEAITLARKGKTITTFGDVVRVKGMERSLLDVRAEGYDVRIVYGIEDALKIAEAASGRDVIFMAVGFETTAPSTAVTLLGQPPKNFSILNCHRYVPPALDALLQLGEVKLDGLIDPGHVSTIIGVRPYEEISRRYKVPQVVAGFEPLDMLMAVYMLALQVKRGEARVENEYARLVKYEGNPKALQLMEKVFEPFDVDWRGFDIIPNSGMRLREKFQNYDARKTFVDELKDLDSYSFQKPKDCRCDEILRGLIDPKECPLFGSTCTPHNPVGPCMVSVEGSCNIEYKYGRGRGAH